jgi:hypothetical protein
MGVLRTRVAPAGRPFGRGNPGGGRPKGVPNKATLEIKDFGRDFLMSAKYRENLKRRIMAGEAPHMEVLLHHYSFGKPRFEVEVASSPPRPDPALDDEAVKREAREVVGRMTKDEQWEYYNVLKRQTALYAVAQARPDAEAAGTL